MGTNRLTPRARGKWGPWLLPQSRPLITRAREPWAPRALSSLDLGRSVPQRESASFHSDRDDATSNTTARTHYPHWRCRPMRVVALLCAGVALLAAACAPKSETPVKDSAATAAPPVVDVAAVRQGIEQANAKFIDAMIRGDSAGMITNY